MDIHFKPAKERSLTFTLLKVSENERTKELSRKKRTSVDKNAKEIDRWEARDERSCRYFFPDIRKKDLVKRKRIKTRNSNQTNESKTKPVTIGNGLKNQGQNQTLQNMYDMYKKNQELKMRTNRRQMVDPVTFHYVPFEERTPEPLPNDALPPIPQSKTTNEDQGKVGLLEALQRYITKKDLMSSKEREGWKALQGKNKEIYDGSPFQWEYGALNSQKERIMIKNAELTRVFNAKMGHQDPREAAKSYVIKVKRPGKPKDETSTVKIERKIDYRIGANGGVDRWVARVMFTESDTEEIASSYSLDMLQMSQHDSDKSSNDEVSCVNNPNKNALLRQHRTDTNQKHTKNNHKTKSSQLGAAKVTVKYNSTQKNNHKKGRKKKKMNYAATASDGVSSMFRPEAKTSISLPTVLKYSTNNRTKYPDKIVGKAIKANNAPSPKRKTSISSDKKLEDPSNVLKVSSSAYQKLRNRVPVTSDEKVLQSPRSSTFDASKLMKQVNDTVQFLKLAPKLEHKDNNDPRNLRNNKGRRDIQNLISNEKALVDVMLNRIQSNFSQRSSGLLSDSWLTGEKLNSEHLVPMTTTMLGESTHFFNESALASQPKPSLRTYRPKKLDRGLLPPMVVGDIVIGDGARNVKKDKKSMKRGIAKDRILRRQARRLEQNLPPKFTASIAATNVNRKIVNIIPS